MEPRGCILNSIYRYSKLVDDGDFQGVGELFRDGEYVIPSLGLSLAGREIAQFFSERLKIYPDGTPHTTHANPNIMLEVEDAGDRASAWTSVLVFQLIERMSGASFQDGTRTTSRRSATPGPGGAGRHIPDLLVICPIT